MNHWGKVSFVLFLSMQSAWANDRLTGEQCGSIENYIQFNNQASPAAREFNCFINDSGSIPLMGGSNSLIELQNKCNALKGGQNGGKVIAKADMPKIILGEKAGYTSVVRTSFQCRAYDVCYTSVNDSDKTEHCYTYPINDMVAVANGSPAYCGVASAGTQSLPQKEFELGVNLNAPDSNTNHVKLDESKVPGKSLRGHFIPFPESNLKDELGTAWKGYAQACFGDTIPKDQKDLASQMKALNKQAKKEGALPCSFAIGDFWKKSKASFAEGCSEYSLKKTADSLQKLGQSGLKAPSNASSAPVFTGSDPSRNPASIQTTAPVPTSGGSSVGGPAPIGR